MRKDIYAAGLYMGYILDCGSTIQGYDNMGNYVGYFLPDSSYVYDEMGDIVGNSVGILEGLCVQSSRENNGY